MDPWDLEGGEAAGEVDLVAAVIWDRGEGAARLLPLRIDRPGPPWPRPAFAGGLRLAWPEGLPRVGSGVVIRVRGPRQAPTVEVRYPSAAAFLTPELPAEVLEMALWALAAHPTLADGELRVAARGVRRLARHPDARVAAEAAALLDRLPVAVDGLDAPMAPALLEGDAEAAFEAPVDHGEHRARRENREYRGHRGHTEHADRAGHADDADHTDHSTRT